MDLIIIETLSNINFQSKNDYVFEGTFTVFDIKNDNDRYYRSKQFVPHVNKLQPKIDKKSLLGELDHPKDFAIKLERASHVIEMLRYDEATNQIVGRIKLLDTAKGRDAKALADAGVPLHISSRASGRVLPNGDVEINELYTYDLVAVPGFSQAQLRAVNENISDTDERNVMRIIDEMNQEMDKYNVVTEHQGVKIYSLEKSQSNTNENSDMDINQIKAALKSDFATTDSVKEWTKHITEALSNIQEQIKSAKINEAAEAQSGTQYTFGFDPNFKFFKSIEDVFVQNGVKADIGFSDGMQVYVTNIDPTAVKSLDGAMRKLAGDAYKFAMPNVTTGTMTDAPNAYAYGFAPDFQYFKDVEEIFNQHGMAFTVNPSSDGSETVYTTPITDPSACAEIDKAFKALAAQAYLGGGSVSQLAIGGYGTSGYRADYSELMAQMAQMEMKVEGISSYANYLAANLKTVADYSELYLRESIEMIADYAQNHIGESVQKIADFVDGYLVEQVENIGTYAEGHLRESLQTLADYTNGHIRENLQTLADYTEGHIRESVQKISDYTEQYLVPIVENLGNGADLSKIEENITINNKKAEHFNDLSEGLEKYKTDLFEKLSLIKALAEEKNASDKGLVNENKNITTDSELPIFKFMPAHVLESWKKLSFEKQTSILEQSENYKLETQPQVQNFWYNLVNMSEGKILTKPTKLVLNEGGQKESPINMGELMMDLKKFR
jgi:hypothetical protein